MNDLGDTAKLAEDLGFAALWVRDVPFYDPNFGDVGQAFDPMVTLGYLAAKTKEIAIGTAGFITQEQNAGMTAVVVISMVLTPVFVMLKNKFVKGKKTAQHEDPNIEEQHPIILVGMGRFGQIIHQMLWATGHRATILDLDEKLIKGFRKMGVKAYFGDASRPELLLKAWIENAKLLIMAINHPEQTLRIIKFAKQVNPNVKIVARAYDRMQTYQLYEKGV